ncbi:zinc finger domain-containing protein [Nonomuraea sp. bgisy094]|uniref:zinc finger domain-containing protein n=1 Tax=Nonomuraea sp. bgisy094 TaxID=3413781 RepID=UPI003EB7FF48
MSRTTPGGFTSTAQADWYGGQFTKEQSEASHRQRRERKAKAAADAARGPAPLPETGDPAWGVPVYGKDLAVGDTIVYLGQHYPVDRFEPYRGSLRGALGAETRTACSGDWEMTIGPNAVIRILPREEAEQPMPSAGSGRELPQLAVGCPTCQAEPGDLCTSHSGTRPRRNDTHQTRTAAWAKSGKGGDR